MTQLLFDELNVGAMISIGTLDRGVISGTAALTGATTFQPIPTVVGVSNSLQSTVPPGMVGSIVAGYYVAGDGGGGSYIWDPGSTANAFAGLVVNPTGHVGPGRWVLLFNGEIPALSCGLKGNDNQANAPINQAAFAALMTFINTLGGFGTTVLFPEGIFWFNDTLNIVAVPNLTLRGVGQRSTSLNYTGAAAPSKNFLTCNSGLLLLQHLAIFPAAAGNPMGIGVRITSQGPSSGSNPSGTVLDDVQVANASDAQIMIGSDTNVDVNNDQINFKHCYLQGGTVGFRVSNGNTNNVSFEDGSIGLCSLAGIEILNFPRAIRLKNIQMSNNGTADILVRRTFAAGLQIVQFQSELNGYPFLVVEQISGGVTCEGTIEIDNWNATQSASANQIQYGGNGVLSLKRCFVAGPGKIAYQPIAIASAGANLMVTDGNFLYAGADYDVHTVPNGIIRHVDLGTVRAVTLSSVADTPHLRLSQTLQVQAMGNTIDVTPPLPFVTTANIPQLCSKSLVVDVDFQAFTAASPNILLVFRTISNHTMVRACMAQVLTGFTGVAGSITFEIGSTNGGTTVYLLPWDVTTATAGGVYRGQVNADLGVQLASATKEPFGHMVATAQTGNGQLACRMISVAANNLGNGSVTNFTAGLIRFYFILDEMVQ